LLSQTECKLCAKVVQVGRKVIANFQPFGFPEDMALCEGCDQLPRVTCAHCTKVVSVSGKGILQHWTFGSSDTNALCDKCDKLTPQTRCALCRKLVRVAKKNVEQYSSYADHAVCLCAKCEVKITMKCRACGNPAAYKGLSGKDESLPGGLFIHEANKPSVIVGWRCSVCAVDPLTDTESAQEAYDEVVAWMTAWVKTCGKSYPNYGNRLRWSIERDRTFDMDDKERELGHCVTTSGVDNVPPWHQIRVLFYMRPISFQQTMAHEFTHALTNELGCGHKAIIEGFCNYVSYLFLLHKADTDKKNQKAEANRAIERMLKNDDELYGTDFRKVVAALNGKAETALTWLGKL